MAPLLEVADAVCALVNASGLLPGGAQAVRAYAPQFRLEDMGALHVTVVPRSRVGAKESRGRVYGYDYRADLAVQQHTDGGAAQDDPLLALVEALADYLERTPISVVGSGSGSGARKYVNLEVKVGLGVKIGQDPDEPAYAEGDVREKNLFTSVISVSYRSFR